MRKVRGNAALTFVNMIENPIAEGLFVNHAGDGRGAIDPVASRERGPRTRCADSESPFLAIKKFSCPPASRLIDARQNRFFGRIAPTDSRADSSSRRSFAVRCGQRDALLRASKRHRTEDSGAA